MAILLVTAVMAVPAMADSHPPRVVDQADLLTTDEEMLLTARLDALSEETQIDMSVVTVSDFTQRTVVEAADDFYDYNGYGLGENADGIMLYISMADRDWYITTCGSAISIFSDSDIQSIGDEMLDDLRYGNYYRAFDTFASACYDEIREETTYHGVRYMIVSLVVGLVAAFGRVGILKSKLKSVSAVDTANDYVVPGSMNITNSREIFLYHTMHVTRKQQSSGSSTHTSSSGRSHGGGGGKF